MKSRPHFHQMQLRNNRMRHQRRMRTLRQHLMRQQRLTLLNHLKEAPPEA
jgi:hypothetical protein